MSVARLKQFYNQERAYIQLIFCVAIALFLIYVSIGEINNLMMYYGGGDQGMQMIWVIPFGWTAIFTFEILWIAAGLSPWVMILGFWLWRRSYWSKENVVELIESEVVKHS